VPVVPVTPFGSQSEAISIANATNLALDVRIFTDSHERAMIVADAINAGAVRINCASSHGLGNISFGGNGASGTGRQRLHQTITVSLERKASSFNITTDNMSMYI